MKKILKITGLLAVIAIALVILSGCGGNKLVGTMEEDGSKSKVVATFDKNDNLKNLEITYEYKNADDAKEAYEEMKKEDAEGYKIKKSGKKETVKMDAKSFAKQTGADEERLTKDNMKELIKFMGYEVKE